MIICKGNVLFLNVWLEIMMRMCPRTISGNGTIDAFPKELASVTGDVIAFHRHIFKHS